MSKKQQAEKNLKLSVKLADFIADYPQLSKSVVSGASVVPFSVNDKDLNEENEKLVEELLREGKKVIKAKEINNTKNPWKFTQAFA